MPDPVIPYDSDSEDLREKTIKFLESHGIKQNFLAKKCSLSNCSISLFLSQRRILVKEKQELIRKFITEN